MMQLDLRRRAAPLLVLAVACGGGDIPDAAEAGPPAPPSVQVAPDNIAVVDTLLVESGPILSGTLIAERTARLRPQVNGTILSLPVRVGTPVSRGRRCVPPAPGTMPRSTSGMPSRAATSATR